MHPGDGKKIHALTKAEIRREINRNQSMNRDETIGRLCRAMKPAVETGKSQWIKGFFHERSDLHTKDRLRNKPSIIIC